MKYIRTKDGIYEVEEWFKPLENDMVYIPNEGLNKILKQADTIEELCDRFVIEYKQHNEQRILKTYIKVERNFLRDKMYKLNHIQNLYGAVWTDKGLIYVAKMNDKGELELL